MPTYEYECTQCAYTFEAFQKMTDPPLTTCPKCKKQLRRLISSGIGVIFKGSGFYATDYRKSAKAANSDTPQPACPKASEGCKGCSAAHPHH